MDASVEFQNLSGTSTFSLSWNNSDGIADDCTKHGLTKFSEDFLYPQGIITLIIALFGIVFNVFNIVVLTNAKMRSPVNVLLILLSIVEMTLLAIYVPYVIMFNLMAPPDVPRHVTTNRSQANYFLFYVDASVFLHISATWLIITTAFFRFLLVQFPLAAARWCTSRRAIISGVTTLVVCFIVCLPNTVRNAVIVLTEYQCYKLDPTLPYYAINASQHFQSKRMELFNYWLFAAMGKFIPSILLLIFTIFLIRVLREAMARRKRLNKGSNLLRNNQHTSSPAYNGHNNTHQAKSSNSGSTGAEYRQTTKMLLAVIILFFTIEFSHGVLVLWANLTNNMSTYYNLGEVVDLLTLTMFSINFVLYSTMSRQYRIIFVSLLAEPFKPKVVLKDGQLEKVMRRTSYSRTHTEHISMAHSELHPLNCKSAQSHRGHPSLTGSNTRTVSNGGGTHV